jgi:pullulanase/glycogen debranching enzyme
MTIWPSRRTRWVLLSTARTEFHYSRTESASGITCDRWVAVGHVLARLSATLSIPNGTGTGCTVHGTRRVKRCNPAKFANRPIHKGLDGEIDGDQALFFIPVQLSRRCQQRRGTGTPRPQWSSAHTSMGLRPTASTRLPQAGVIYEAHTRADSQSPGYSGGIARHLLQASHPMSSDI